EIPLDTLVELIEQALYLAYQKTEGAWPDARAELDKSSGEVRILAVEFDNDDNPIGEFDDTPTGFGRIAAQTARQVIHQRLRDVEDESLLGTFKGREGEIASGTIQQGRDPQMVQVDLGDVEAVLPPHEQVPGEEDSHGTRMRGEVAAVALPSATIKPGGVPQMVQLDLGDVGAVLPPHEQVPGEEYSHGPRMRVYIADVHKGTKGTSVTVSRTHPNLVRRLFAHEA